MTHIKRDGAYLCKLDIEYPKKKYKFLHDKNNNFIKFSDAHKLNFDLNDRFSPFCKNCVKAYFETLSRMKQPIIKAL